MGGVLGGGKGGSTPAPDFGKAAQASSISSRPNTTNAMGGQTWGFDANGRPVSSFNFTGQAADTMNALQGGMNSAANYDPTQARDQAVNQNLQYGMSQLKPMWDQQNQGFNSSAANQGLDPGSQAWNAQHDAIGRQQANQFGNVFTNALNAGNETQRTQMAQMMQPFQQAGSMFNMLNQQGPNMGKGADFLGAAENQYTAQRAQDAQAQAGKGGLFSGLGGLAGTAFGGPLGGAAGSGLFGGGKGGGGGPNAASMALGGRGYDDNLGGYNF